MPTENTPRQTEEPPDDLWWSFTGGLDTCFSEHDGEYRNCCMRAGLAYVLKVHEEQIRAGQEPLRPEYGIRTVHISTRISEEAVSDNLDDATALIAVARAERRFDVVSRELIGRQVTDWHPVAGEDS